MSAPPAHARPPVELLTPLPQELERAARPVTLVDPFRAGAPHPLALAAARQVMAQLRAGAIAPGLPTSVLHGVDGGKMFGVLVVEASDGQLGFLKAFSGQLQQRWDVPGYVPPVFDRAARAAVEPRAEAIVRALTARVIAAQQVPGWAELRARAQALASRHTEEDAQRARSRSIRRARRSELRAQAAEGLRAAADAEAREDEAEHRRVKARMREEREAVEVALAGFERRLQRLKRHRINASRISSRLLYETYVFEDFTGTSRTLRELCAPVEPPSGTGDCAAPKLLVHARKEGLRPLALAELWWGGSPRGGGRREGELYPACPEKCGLLLPFLLGGLERT